MKDNEYEKLFLCLRTYQIVAFVCITSLSLYAKKLSNLVFFIFLIELI